MNKELVDRWLEALESGEYKQGRGSLHPKGDTFCCLGVLCDLFGDGSWGIADNLNVYVPKNDGPITVSMPPGKLWDSLGLSINQGKLANMNDKGKSFVEIAAYIRQEIERCETIETRETRGE